MRRTRRLMFGRLLVLALLLTHAALMATDHHIVAMEPLSSPEAAAQPVDLLATLGAGGHEHSSTRERVPEAPHPVLGDCPVQQAVLPLLLVLLILVAVAFAHGGTPPVATGLTRYRPAWWSLPPPLPPSRRRALLQVFRN